jgi:hypothetical protein
MRRNGCERGPPERLRIAEGMQRGQDFATAAGTGIYAAQPGTVVHIDAAQEFGQRTNTATAGVAAGRTTWRHRRCAGGESDRADGACTTAMRDVAGDRHRGRNDQPRPEERC